MRKLLRKGEFYFTLVLVVIVSLFVIDSFHLPFQARLMPLVVGMPTVIMLILIALSNRYPRLVSPFDSAEKRRERERETSVATDTSPRVVKPPLASVARMSAWVVLLFVSILLVGFYVTAPLYVFLYLRLHGREGWLTSALNSMAAGAVVYVSFHVLIELELFKGVVFGARLPAL